MISILRWQLSFMGFNRLEDEEGEQQNGQTVDGFLPQDAWQKLGKRAESCFRTAPTFHYMWVSLQARKASTAIFNFTVLPFTLCPRPMFTSVVRYARNGAFHVEPPPPKPRIARQLMPPTKEAKRIIPTQVNGVPLLPWAVWSEG